MAIGFRLARPQAFPVPLGWSETAWDYMAIYDLKARMDESTSQKFEESPFYMVLG